MTEATLASLGRFIRGVGYNPDEDLRARPGSDTVELLRANNVHDGRLVLDEVQHVHRRRVRSDQYLTDGDVLICAANGSKRLVGKAAQVWLPDSRELTLGAFMMSFRPNPAKVFPAYSAQQFHSKKYRDWVELLLSGSSINNLRPSAVGELRVWLPNFEEQQRIAQALMDADELIVALERLIAKKQAIKQGMMQQLLTGRTRLPGFTAEWQSVALGELGVFLKGRGVKRDDVRSSGVSCIRYGELYTGFINYTYSANSFVTDEVAATALPIFKGDLLFAGSGETRDEIGLCVAYVGENAAVAGGDIIVLRGTGFNPIFLATLTNLPTVANQKARAGQGDAVVHISSRALSEIMVSIPEKPEQNAIAKVLVDADQELVRLRARLTKAGLHS
ncbi:restriction endonuclease subunit S [Kocuria marina subsp. indica]|uniref:restriction endonuclease subunit S n=1 Tax=Kocuria marina TaxID=223184 RepID=UPI00103AE503|nr:restriction endonuclease subunit S [Kocuria indica]QBJ21044.1 restriction endonuclease subunit S [Kocuria indica]